MDTLSEVEGQCKINLSGLALSGIEELKANCDASLKKKQR